MSSLETWHGNSGSRGNICSGKSSIIVVYFKRRFKRKGAGMFGILKSNIFDMVTGTYTVNQTYVFTVIHMAFWCSCWMKVFEKCRWCV